MLFEAQILVPFISLFLFLALKCGGSNFGGSNKILRFRKKVFVINGHLGNI